MKAGRLALFVPTLHGGGAERVVLNLARAFSELGHQVDLLVCRAEGPLLAEIPPQVRLVALDARRVLSAILPLRRYLRQERPAALLSAMDHANVAALLARGLSFTGTRVAISVHVAVTVLTAAEGVRRQRFLTRMLPLAYRFADEIIAVSNGVAEDIARLTGIRRDRIAVIHNPIVTPELVRAAAAPVEHPWFLPDQPPVVLGIGRLEPQKDFATLLRAFAGLRRERRARLVILGTGSLLPELQRQATQLGIAADVWFGGFQQNPYCFMRAARVVVLSSAYEGFGNVLVEALACGTPVVSTDCPSGPSEILEAGRYGRLVPVGVPEALAQAISATLAEEPRREALVERGRAFGAEASAMRYLGILLPGCAVG